MTQLNELRIMNDTMIQYLKKIGMNCSRYELIKKILSDDACFFKIDKEDAYIILEDIGIENNQIEETYSKLISSDIFYDLINSKKIQENDVEIKVKYKTYDVNDIFKKKDLDKIGETDTSMIKIQKESFFKRLIMNIKRILHI